jgi:signal transduction histidine kinase
VGSVTAQSGWDLAEPEEPVDGRVVEAALSRAVLVARAAVTATAAGAGVLIMADTWRQVALLVAIVVVCVVEVAVLTRWPAVVRWPVAIIGVDSAGLVGALILAGPGLAYFCYGAGCAALAGALLGLRALPVWIIQAALGFVAAGHILKATSPAPEVAVFVLAIPPATILAGMGMAGARTMVANQVRRMVGLVASAQRSAAASERLRLARELHDSVSKTLRGVSFAALALPSSLRRHPALAEQLASTVSNGAEAAVNQARELMFGLRLDNPESGFAETIDAICREWMKTSRINVRVALEPLEPPVEVRYELTRILHEALTNVEKHAGAERVAVSLTSSNDVLYLTITDDGRGMPRRKKGSRSGHFGLDGMAERARTVGGTLHVSSAPGAGVTIIVSVGLPRASTALGELGSGKESHDRGAHRRRQPDRTRGTARIPGQYR